jgi:iron complex outermembrane recepter protein
MLKDIRVSDAIHSRSILAALLAAHAVSSFAATGGGQVGALEEIVVTAQRRAENLQDVPIAISAFSKETVEALGINDPGSLAQVVPGITMNRTSAAMIPFIRGIGNPSSTVGNEPSVASYIDDVYQISGAGSFFEFNNIEQVEVLKGPQGTLFGRNATGGVVHIHTKDPSHEPAMDIALKAANYDTFGAQIYGTTGLTDTLSANIAAYTTEQDDGWGTNHLLGTDTYTSKGNGVRAKVLFEPSDRTSVRLTVSGESLEGSQGLAWRPKPGAFGRDFYNPDIGFFDAEVNSDLGYTNSVNQASIKVSHDFDAATLVSITSYSDLEIDQNGDIDTGPVEYFTAFIDMMAETYTQEIQLLSPDDSSLQWIVGAFFLKDSAAQESYFFGLDFAPFTEVNTWQSQETESVSIFAEGAYDITERARVTLGIRYTSDEREYEGINVLAIPGILEFPLGPFADDQDSESVTGRVTLDYHFSDDLMAYIGYNSGFKSGVYNLFAFGNVPPVEPEELDAYTLGIKSEFLDSKLRLNAEVFYYDYTNIQVQTTVGGSAVITNAGAATIEGFELSLNAVPTENLTIIASIAITDGEYDEFMNGPAFFPGAPDDPVAIPSGGCVGVPPYPTPGPTRSVSQVPCNLAGMDTINTQPFSGNISILYSMVAGDIPVDLALSWYHTDKYYFEPHNYSDVEQPVTDIINASMRLSLANDQYGLFFWGKNLTDEEYYTYVATGTGSGTKMSAAPPRTYGVTLEAHF